MKTNKTIPEISIEIQKTLRVARSIEISAVILGAFYLLGRIKKKYGEI